MVISGLHDLCRNHLVDGYYASRSLKPTWALVTAAPRRDVTDKSALMPLAHLHNLDIRGYQAIPAYAALLFRAAVTPDATASQPTHTLLAVINTANTNEVHVWNWLAVSQSDAAVHQSLTSARRALAGDETAVPSWC